MGTRSTHSRKQSVGEVGRGVAAEGRAVSAAERGRQRTISVGIAEGERIEFALGDGVVRTATVAGGGVAIGSEVREEWVFTPGEIAGQAGNDEAAPVMPGTTASVMPGSTAPVMPGSTGHPASVMPGLTGHLPDVPNGEISTPLGTKTAEIVPNGSFSAPLGTVNPGLTASVMPGTPASVMPGTPASVMPGSTGHPYFTLKGVEIGKGFHWQRRQDQCFRGSLRLIAREGRVIAINVVGIEDYLQCVIASEMSPTAGFEFLKAHAVISRSWLLAQLDKRDEVQKMSATGNGAGPGLGYSSVECDTPEELIRWQDREDHRYYDFCADDHCQRYQGIPMASIVRGGKQVDTQKDAQSTSTLKGGEHFGKRADSQEDTLHGAPGVDPAMIRKTARVIEATWGQVLWYDGHVCDARFSKCCGGALEEFKYCWEGKEVPYLKYARDYESMLPGSERKPDGLLVADGAESTLAHPDLRDEQAARRWILSSPRAFCNTRSSRLLGQVLKDYDSETKDFYRWKVEYTAEELRQIILERTGEDYGQILDLIPLERGVSGRICRLKIVGTKKTKIIGKELEIRKTLSRSHLYSSAFVVEKTSDGFILRGAGWGHGVGLCQIGAAAMGARGYDYRIILAHYYPNSELKTIY